MRSINLLPDIDKKPNLAFNVNGLIIDDIKIPKKNLGAT